MSDYIRQRAEDPFFTTKAGHLGLGMPQAYEALQSVGGQWRIDSQPEHGTRITLLLPIEEPWVDPTEGLSMDELLEAAAQELDKEAP